MELQDLELSNGERVFVGLTVVVGPRTINGAPVIGESQVAHLALPLPLPVKGSPSEVADRLRGNSVVKP